MELTLTRRGFIGRTAIAAACAAGCGFALTACRGMRRAEIGPGGPQFETIPSVPDELVEVLYYASLAPSGHNAQPWYLEVVDENTWIIGLDLRRQLPAVDPNNREALLSIGAFAENLSLAAGAKGYDTNMEVLAAGPSDEEVLRVSLQRGTPSGYPLNRLVTRRTTRGGHRATELRSDDVKLLSKPLEGRLFYFPRGSEHSNCIAEGTVEAFRAQSYRDEAQAELAEWIRFSNRDAKRHRDGLTTESMEIDGLAGWYVRNFMDKTDVMKKSFRTQGIKGTAKTAHEGGGWFVITSKGDSVADLVETGRAVERMWLIAKERMIAVHPMTQILEEKRWLEEIASEHDPGMIPQFILRVGYLDSYPAPVSLRRPVSWFLRT